jgi:hypothetical protein
MNSERPDARPTVPALPRVALPPPAVRDQFLRELGELGAEDDAPETLSPCPDCDVGPCGLCGGRGMITRSQAPASVRLAG